MYITDNRRDVFIKADLDAKATDDMCVFDFLGTGHSWSQFPLDFFAIFENILGFRVRSLPPNPFVFLNNELYVVAYGWNRLKYPSDETLSQTMIAKFSFTPPLAEYSYNLLPKNITEVWGQIDSIYALEMQGLVFTLSNDTGYFILDLNPDAYDTVKSGPTAQETGVKWKLFQAR